MNQAGTGIVHVHSNYSHDGRDALEELRASALARDIGFIGMTDHAEDLDESRFSDFVAHCHRVSDHSLRMFPGLEYRFAGYPGLHLLALGLTDFIQPATPEEFCAMAARAAAFTIVAHPVLPRYEIPECVALNIDAVEVWNAAYNTRFLPDTRAIRLFHRLSRNRPDLVAVAGLDQHDSRNDRETRVVLLDPGSDDPLRELKAGRFMNRGRTLTFDSRARFGTARLMALSAARWSLDRVNEIHEAGTRIFPRPRRRRR